MEVVVVRQISFILSLIFFRVVWVVQTAKRPHSYVREGHCVEKIGTLWLAVSENDSNVVVNEKVYHISVIPTQHLFWYFLLNK